MLILGFLNFFLFCLRISASRRRVVFWRLWLCMGICCKIGFWWGVWMLYFFWWVVWIWCWCVYFLFYWCCLESFYCLFLFSCSRFRRRFFCIVIVWWWCFFLMLWCVVSYVCIWVCMKYCLILCWNFFDFWIIWRRCKINFVSWREFRDLVFCVLIVLFVLELLFFVCLILL